MATTGKSATAGLCGSSDRTFTALQRDSDLHKDTIDLSLSDGLPSRSMLTPLTDGQAVTLCEESTALLCMPTPRRCLE